MVQMATPWIHPQTGVYYLRRQIPKALRPAFGGSALHKQSLRTKDIARAALLFTAANAELDRRFEEARHRLRKTGSPAPSARDRADELVLAYFRGPESEGTLMTALLRGCHADCVTNRRPRHRAVTISASAAMFDRCTEATIKRWLASVNK